MIFNKKDYFSELWWCDEYYIAGINILDDGNRTYIKKVDYNLCANVNYRKIRGAKLYLIKTDKTKFKIAIARLNEETIVISYLSSRQFLKSHKDTNLCLYTSKKNAELLKQYILNKISKEKESSVLYSKDFCYKAVIKQRKEDVVVELFCLEINPDAEIDFPKNINEPYLYDWCSVETSYYDTKAHALKETKLRLNIK